MRSTVIALDSVKLGGEFQQLPERVPKSRWDELLAATRTSAPVSDALENLESGNVQVEGDLVVSNGESAMVLLAMCRAYCGLAEFQIRDRDFFFQDIASMQPGDALARDDAKEAWFLFHGIADLSCLRRQRLPWWMRDGASYCCWSIGLIDADEVRKVHAHTDAIRAQLSADDLADDAGGVLRVVEVAAARGGWLLGLEPGT